MNLDSTRRSAVDALTSAAPAMTHANCLTDCNETRKVGVKGPCALAWLREQGVSNPPDLYDVTRVGDCTLVVRVGADEVIVESHIPSDFADRLDNALIDRAPGVYRVEQELASFLLSGAAASSVWHQTCGVDLVNEPPNRVVYTRVAGISCGVITVGADTDRGYRIWVDYSFAPELWSTLVEIVRDL
jgi:sarcosine oxidase gamma subunit